MELEPLLADILKRGRHVIIITSDHAGHARQHGTSHPDDYKLPLIIATDTPRNAPLPSGTFRITALRVLAQKLLAVDAPPTDESSGKIGR